MGWINRSNASAVPGLLVLVGRKIEGGTLLHRVFRAERVRDGMRSPSPIWRLELTIALAHRLMTVLFHRSAISPLAIVMVAIISSTQSQSNEEIGWRGYASMGVTALSAAVA
jgi:hypothetical protein